MSTSERSRYWRLSPYLYLGDLFAGRRVLEIGCGSGEGAVHIATRGAAWVLGVDRSPERIDKARARHRRPNLEFRVQDYGALEIEDHSFDVVVVPDAASLVRWLGFLEEVHRVLAKDGLVVMTSPSADRPGGQGGVSYHEMVDRLAPLFGDVRMFGMSPFVGLSLVEFSGEGGEIPELELDTSLQAAAGEDPVVEYVAVAGPLAGGPRGFSVVQLPATDGIDAVAEAAGDAAGVSGGDGTMAARLKEAEAVAAEAMTRMRELEAELSRRSRQPGAPAATTGDLERRLAEAEAAREKAEADARVLEQRILQAEEEIGRVAAQASIELEAARQAAETAARRLKELEGAQDMAPATRSGNGHGSETGGLGRQIELLVEAARLHERAFVEKQIEIEERDAYIDELEDEVRRAQGQVERVAREAASARALSERLDEELRVLRVRAARAEGQLLKHQHQAAAGGGERGPQTALPAGVVRSGQHTAEASSRGATARSRPSTDVVVSGDSQAERRLKALEAEVAEKAAAAQKASERWKQAESKSDELWRKIGELQSELEKMREENVERARQQRQAQQVAITRAVEEGSKKLVSVQDQLSRSEKDRKKLESEARDLKARLDREKSAREEAEAAAQKAREELERLRAQVAGAEDDAFDGAVTAELESSTKTVSAPSGDALAARLEEVDEILRILAAALREEELRLAQIEDELREVHEHARAIPDPVELERELVNRALDQQAQEKLLRERAEKIDGLMGELGERDAELAIQHARVQRLQRALAQLVERITGTRQHIEGKPGLEVTAALDRLAAEASEISRDA